MKLRSRGEPLPNDVPEIMATARRENPTETGTPPADARAHAGPERAAARVGAIVAPLRAWDRAAWERLARGYHDFYEEAVTADAYESVWTRLTTSGGGAGGGLGAYVDGRLVGIAHYLFHAHVWDGTVCYLQDLFVDEAARGCGIGRALIEGVARVAAERGAFRLYWMTKADNAAARLLYDKVATLTGYVRYDVPLERRPR